MGQISVFRIDLTQIEGEGDFLCPSCKTPISPDDESEVTYQVADVKTGKDGALESLTIRCKKCRSTIHLVGFEALNELDEPNEPAAWDE